MSGRFWSNFFGLVHYLVLQELVGLHPLTSFDYTLFLLKLTCSYLGIRGVTLQDTLTLACCGGCKVCTSSRQRLWYLTWNLAWKPWNGSGIPHPQLWSDPGPTFLYQVLVKSNFGLFQDSRCERWCVFLQIHWHQLTNQSCSRVHTFDLGGIRGGVPEKTGICNHFCNDLEGVFLMLFLMLFLFQFGLWCETQPQGHYGCDLCRRWGSLQRNRGQGTPEVGLPQAEHSRGFRPVQWTRAFFPLEIFKPKFLLIWYRLKLTYWKQKHMNSTAFLLHVVVFQIFQNKQTKTCQT